MMVTSREVEENRLMYDQRWEEVTNNILFTIEGYPDKYFNFKFVVGYLKLTSPEYGRSKLILDHFIKYHVLYGITPKTGQPMAVELIESLGIKPHYNPDYDW